MPVVLTYLNTVVLHSIVNPLGPKSDQHPISPRYINAL